MKKHWILAGVIASAMALAAGNTSLAEGKMNDWPDAFSHASSLTTNYKAVLTGEDFDNAMQFLVDSSHYIYVNKATPYYGNYYTYPETGFDTDWRSPVNGRVYRGAYYDPLNRSVLWMTTNPNGGVNTSVGSYWACIPPHTELVLQNNELQGYQVSDQYQLISCMKPGQSVENFIANGRGSLVIDGALLNHYGITNGWENRNVLVVDVKLDHYENRKVTAKQFYDGDIPTTTTWMIPARWSAVPGWGADAGENQFRTIAQFWGCASGEAAAWNLNSDEERAAYLERADSDPGVAAALDGVVYDMYFEVTQITNVTQELGFDFEMGSGKINALDMNHDGLLDRDENGSVIVQDAYGKKLLPDWAYDLDYNLDWWVLTDGSGTLINSEGKKIVGANPDGTYILSDGTEETKEEPAIELADNERIGTGIGNGGKLTVKVTMDGDDIAAVDILSHNETSGICDEAIASLPIAIVEANSADVDGIAGATMTSNAIKEAVQDALAK